ncbi:MAG: hypothetical protein ACLP7W_10370, partial [Solirubrobacteraceae bacterium]
EDEPPLGELEADLAEDEEDDADFAFASGSGVNGLRDEPERLEAPLVVSATAWLVPAGAWVMVTADFVTVAPEEAEREGGVGVELVEEPPEPSTA